MQMLLLIGGDIKMIMRYEKVTLTHQHNMKGVEPNPTTRVTHHVSENGDPPFRP